MAVSLEQLLDLSLPHIVKRIFSDFLGVRDLASCLMASKNVRRLIQSGLDKNGALTQKALSQRVVDFAWGDPDEKPWKIKTVSWGSVEKRWLGNISALRYINCIDEKNELTVLLKMYSPLGDNFMFARVGQREVEAQTTDSSTNNRETRSGASKRKKRKVEEPTKRTMKYEFIQAQLAKESFDVDCTRCVVGSADHILVFPHNDWCCLEGKNNSVRTKLYDARTLKLSHTVKMPPLESVILLDDGKTFMGVHRENSGEENEHTALVVYKLWHRRRKTWDLERVLKVELEENIHEECRVYTRMSQDRFIIVNVVKATIKMFDLENEAEMTVGLDIPGGSEYRYTDARDNVPILEHPALFCVVFLVQDRESEFQEDDAAIIVVIHKETGKQLLCRKTFVDYASAGIGAVVLSDNYLVLAHLPEYGPDSEEGVEDERLLFDVYHTEDILKSAETGLEPQVKSRLEMKWIKMEKMDILFERYLMLYDWEAEGNPHVTRMMDLSETNPSPEESDGQLLREKFRLPGFISRENPGPFYNFILIENESGKESWKNIVDDPDQIEEDGDDQSELRLLVVTPHKNLLGMQNLFDLHHNIGA